MLCESLLDLLKLLLVFVPTADALAHVFMLLIAKVRVPSQHFELVSHESIYQFFVLRSRPSIQTRKEFSITYSLFVLGTLPNDNCHLFRKVPLLHSHEKLARVWHLDEQVRHMVHDVPKSIVLAHLEGTSHDLISLFGGYPVLVDQISK